MHRNQRRYFAFSRISSLKMHYFPSFWAYRHRNAFLCDAVHSTSHLLTPAGMAERCLQEGGRGGCPGEPIARAGWTSLSVTRARSCAWMRLPLTPGLPHLAPYGYTGKQEKVRANPKQAAPPVQHTQCPMPQCGCGEDHPAQRDPLQGVQGERSLLVPLLLQVIENDEGQSMLMEMWQKFFCSFSCLSAVTKKE